MRVALKYVMAAALVATPALASAAPILPSGATWSAVGTPDKNGTPFWDNQSVDFCGGTQDCNAGQAILFQNLFTKNYDPADGVLEYLHNGSDGAVAFAFGTSVTGWTPEFTITNQTNAFPGQAVSGAITYTNPDLNNPGVNLFAFDSINNWQQFALFRQVGKTQVRYFFAFEDDASRGSDRDYNDLIMSIYEARPVPEPGTLLLLGTAALGLAARRARSRR